MSSFATAQVNGTWIAGDGLWSKTVNWANGVKPGAGGEATFGFDAAIAAASNPTFNTPYPTIDLDENVTLSKISFLAPVFVNQIYSTQSNRSIELVGPAEVFVDRGVSAPASGGVFYIYRWPSLTDVSGTAGLTKTGPGVLGLTAIALSGDVRVNEGLISFGDSSDFGNPSNRVILNGGGLTDATIPGPTLYDRTTIIGPAGGAMRPLGELDVDGDISGSGMLTIKPQVTEYARGEVVMRSAKSLNGVVRLERNRLTLRGTGALLNVSEIQLASGTFQVETAFGGNLNRIGDSVPIHIRSADFRLRGNNSISVSEQVGTISVSGGASITPFVVLEPTNISAAGLVREDRGVVSLPLGPTTGAASVTVFNAPTLGGGGATTAGATNISIIPFAANPSIDSFITWNSTTKLLRALADAEYKSLSSAANDDNAVVNGNLTNSSARTVNALRVRNGTLSGTGTVSVTSGALVARSATISVPLDFPNGEAIITGNNATFSGPIFAANGVTSSGTVTLSGVSTYTGTTTVHSVLNVQGATVTPGVPGPLGIDGSTIQMSPGATLSFNGTSFNRAIAANDTGEINIAMQNGAVMNGAISVNGVMRTDGGDFAGNVSGAGLVLIGGGAVTLRGNNSFTDGVNLYSGTLSVGSSTALGTGRVLMHDGYLRAASAPITIGNTLKCFDHMRFGAGPMLTITGDVEMGTDNTISLGDGANTTLAGRIIAGPIKVQQADSAGTGLLRLSGDNRAFGGTLTINDRSVVEIGGANALGSTLAGTVVNGGVLQFSNANGDQTIVGEPLRFTHDSSFEPVVRNLSGNHRWAGPLSAASATAEFNIVAGSLTLTSTTLGGAVGDSSMDIVKTGSAPLIMRRPDLEQIDLLAGNVQLQPNGTDAGAGRIPYLRILAGTALDVADNDLIAGAVLSGSANGSTIPLQLKAGYAGGAWNGPGINSSAAANNSVGNTTLGVLTSDEFAQNNGAATFGGFPVSADRFLIKYTYYGDVDFNGQLDVSDYNLIDFGFANHLTGWANGDVDFSGAVDVSDYNLIDFAFVTQNGVLLRAIAYLDGSDRSGRGMSDPSLQEVAAHLDAFGEPYRSAFLAQVPEPSALVLAALGASALRRRRRFSRPRTKYC